MVIRNVDYISVQLFSERWDEDSSDIMFWQIHLANFFFFFVIYRLFLSMYWNN